MPWYGKLEVLPRGMEESIGKWILRHALVRAFDAMSATLGI